LVQPVKVSWNLVAVSLNGRDATKTTAHCAPDGAANGAGRVQKGAGKRSIPASRRILDLLGLFLRQQPERQRDLSGDHRERLFALL
jgi:hypothetical protein